MSFFDDALNVYMPGIGSGGNPLHNVAKQLTPQNEFQAADYINLQDFANAIKQSQGNFELAQQKQQQLAEALMANSTVDPSQLMLNQSLNKNLQQNQGMIASQKGINPGLAQRLISQNQGAMSQEAAGQAATMNAQNTFNRTNLAGQVLGNMANQNAGHIGTLGGLTNQSVLGTQQINSGSAAQNAAANQATTSGILNGISSAAQQGASGGGGMAEGGMVGYAQGGKIFGNQSSQAIADQILAQAGIPQWGTGMSLDFGGGNNFGSSGGGGGGGMAMAGGPMDAGMPMMPEGMGGAAPMMVASQGGNVSGQAKVRGDSSRNDTVPAMLSPGEIVIPRSIAQSDDAPEKSKEFIEHIKKQTSKSKGAAGGYAQVLEAHRKLGEALQKCKGGMV